jgi:hypothetical protein
MQRWTPALQNRVVDATFPGHTAHIVFADAARGFKVLSMCFAIKPEAWLYSAMPWRTGLPGVKTAWCVQTRATRGISTGSTDAAKNETV